MIMDKTYTAYEAVRQFHLVNEQLIGHENPKRRRGPARPTTCAFALLSRSWVRPQSPCMRRSWSFSPMASVICSTSSSAPRCLMAIPRTGSLAELVVAKAVPQR
jgi:hypothetical protein